MYVFNSSIQEFDFKEFTPKIQPQQFKNMYTTKLFTLQRLLITQNCGKIPKYPSIVE